MFVLVHCPSEATSEAQFKVVRTAQGKVVKWWDEDLPVQYTLHTEECDVDPESVLYETLFGVSNWTLCPGARWTCEYFPGSNPLVQNYIRWTHDPAEMPIDPDTGMKLPANTWMNADPSTGRLNWAYTLINEGSYDWSAGKTPGKHDIRSTVTHEVGHWLALDNLGDNFIGKAAMWEGAIPNDDSRSYLHDVDKEGIRWLYPGSEGMTWGELKGMYCGDACSYSSAAGWPGPVSPDGFVEGVFSRIGSNFAHWVDFDSTAYSYQLLKGVGDSLSYQQLEDPEGGRTYVDDEVLAGQPYYYRVASYDADTTISWREYTSPTMAAVAGVGMTTLSQFPQMLAVDGEVAYVSLPDRVLEVYDVSSSELPVQISSVDLMALGVKRFVNSMIAADGLLCISSMDYEAGRICVMDVSNPSSPAMLGYTTNPYAAYTLSVVYPYAYCAQGTGGLRIFDVSTPSSILEVGTYPAGLPDPDYNIRHVFVAGDIAYVTNDNWDSEVHGLHLVDIANVANPTMISKVEIPPDYPYSCCPPTWIVHDFDGTYAYATNQGSAFRGMIDVSDPDNPSVFDYFEPPLFSGPWVVYPGSFGIYTRSMTRRGDYLYVGGKAFYRRGGKVIGWGGVEIYDVSTPASPQFMSAIADTGGLWYGCDECSSIYTCLAEAGNNVYLVRSPYYNDTPQTYQLQVFQDNANCDAEAISDVYSAVSLSHGSSHMACPGGDADRLELDIAVRDGCGGAVPWIPVSSVYVVASADSGWISCLEDTTYATEATDESGRTTIEIPRYGGCGEVTLNVYADGVLIAQPTVTIRSPDLNADCAVDACDYDAFQDLFTQDDPCADLDGDSEVTMLDLLRFNDHYQTGSVHFSAHPGYSHATVHPSDPSCLVLCPAGDAASFVDSVKVRNARNGRFCFSDIRADSVWAVIPQPGGGGMNAAFRFLCRPSATKATADHAVDMFTGDTEITVNSGGGHSQDMPMTTYAGTAAVDSWTGDIISPDIDANGRVDYTDVMIFSIDDQGAYNFRSDMNCDHDVNDADFLFINAHYGHRCGASSQALAGGDAASRPWSPEVVTATRSVVPNSVLDQWLSYDLHPELRRFLEEVRSLVEPEELARGEDKTAAASTSLLPKVTAIDQNVPNPFRVTALISYQVAPPGGRVDILIFDAAGRRVRTLVDKETPPGFYAIPWDGRNDSGRQVTSGVYFYQMKAPGFRSDKKMMLVR